VPRRAGASWQVWVSSGPCTARCYAPARRSACHARGIKPPTSITRSLPAGCRRLGRTSRRLQRRTRGHGIPRGCRVPRKSRPRRGRSNGSKRPPALDSCVIIPLTNSISANDREEYPPSCYGESRGTVRARQRHGEGMDSGGVTSEHRASVHTEVGKLKVEELNPTLQLSNSPTR